MRRRPRSLAEDGGSDGRNGERPPLDNVLRFPGEPDNVVQFPTDWIGPRSELVPFGPRADRADRAASATVESLPPRVTGQPRGASRCEGATLDRAPTSSGESEQSFVRLLPNEHAREDEADDL